MRKAGRLIAPVQSKYPGQPRLTQRRVGTRCSAERNPASPGQWILWFGREYALIDAIKLPQVLEFE